MGAGTLNLRKKLLLFHCGRDALFATFCVSASMKRLKSSAAFRSIG